VRLKLICSFWLVRVSTSMCSVTLTRMYAYSSDSTSRPMITALMIDTAQDRVSIQTLECQRDSPTAPEFVRMECSSSSFGNRSTSFRDCANRLTCSLQTSNAMPSQLTRSRPASRNWNQQRT
jgi:hypothetical protein